MKEMKKISKIDLPGAKTLRIKEYVERINSKIDDANYIIDLINEAMEKEEAEKVSPNSITSYL